MSTLATVTVVSSNMRPDFGQQLVPLPFASPGVVIFVHGVNSDGEWYEASEGGLCAGLNSRLARQSSQIAFPSPEGGQLTPLCYTPELTSDGYLQRERDAKNFILPDPAFSNVIRFRWGYKASTRELKAFGDKVWLNEKNYWGGGPFANGCSTIADLWGEGLSDRLFLWITAQHLNPAVGRDVYACPPRAYYVVAALRLARLIESIRKKQQDCPITIVCHSQGNMVGIGGAFLADKLGVQADSYVLCNPPLSLMDSNFTEGWSQRGMKDGVGHGGRQNVEARIGTLKNFFELLRARAGLEQDAGEVDRRMANATPLDGSQGYTAAADRQAHGLAGHTYGRVTLYCNPHDQVISALPVQGIGWRGMSAEEIKAASGQGVFTQRVFAQGYPVGQAPGSSYDYWMNRWNKEAGLGQDGFWNPPSPAVRYSLRQGLEASDSVLGKMATVVLAPVVSLVGLARMKVNGEPDKDWRIPIDAPPLPQAILPMSLRYGSESAAFDEGYDPAGSARNAGKEDSTKDPSDAYDRHAAQTTRDGAGSDAPVGDEASEARLRYEDRARLRMKARRSGRVDENGKVIGEDEPDQATPEYKSWRSEQIATFLAEGIDQVATDHSTIMTNPRHARSVLAYDVAIGVCDLTKEDWKNLRIEADWRYLDDLPKDHASRRFSEYFKAGTMSGKPLEKWVTTGEASLPDKVLDDRGPARSTNASSRDEDSQEARKEH